MNGIPDKVEIRVKEYGGTYIATCKEAKMRASCTSGAKEAAHCCAYKIFGSDFTLERRSDGANIWTAAAKKPSAWRTDLPDCDISVLVRTTHEEYPIMFGFYDGEEWVSDNGETMKLLKCEVIGWMHLEDAARILDAANS